MEGAEHRPNTCDSILKNKSTELKKLDMSYMNGFYTIADTMHKDNAHSAVTCTTQMGEIRVSSKIAESSSHEKLHSERTCMENNVHEENYTSLKDLSDCMEQMILEDENLAQHHDANNLTSVGNNDGTLSDLNVLIPVSHHPETGTSESGKGSVKEQNVRPSCCDGCAYQQQGGEELPTPLSDFILGYERGLMPPPVHVPLDDSDLDTIITNKNEIPVKLVAYESELQMPDIMRLITKDLSEPYSIYTYRYFIHNWPNLCFLAVHGSQCVGAIVCKLDVHKKVVRRGYIAMLAVDENYRKLKIGSSLVRKVIRAMIRGQCDEVVLETEITNKPALRLYENLGFSRDKRLFSYYLNGVDALRLKLWLR